MKKNIVIVCIAILCFVTTAQTQNIISVAVNRKSYEKIAVDSLKQIYNNQVEYFTQYPNKVNRVNSITEKHKFEDLSFFSIPKFRLFEDAKKEFQCESNIENYIAFNENIKYQDVIILNDKKESICVVDIPNFDYEQSRIHNPGLTYSFGKIEYNELVLEHFLSFPDGYVNKEPWRIINSRKMNFFFEIYGINAVLFEIEKSTGLLYANWFGTGSKRQRMLANDYIRKYIGKKVIRELASGNYDLYQYSKPCSYNKKNNDVILKVIE